MNKSHVAAPDDQSVSFVELFFDLVFVFSVTQVVTILHGHITWTTVGQAVLVFWLVLWAWSQFTWAPNAANNYVSPCCPLGPRSHGRCVLHGGRGPDAFHDRALWFSITYVLMRSIGMALMTWTTSSDDVSSTGVRIFTIMSVGGLVAVIVGGAAGDSAQYWLWGLAIVLDVGTGLVAGKPGWLEPASRAFCRAPWPVRHHRPR